MKRNKRSKEWFDDDVFWRETFSFVFSEKRLAHANEAVEKVLKLTQLKAKSSVLDLCCGPGRYSIVLAQRGFLVTGVDRTRYLLDRARAGARTARVKVEWIQNDMRDFVRREAYDFVLSMFSSFGYFEVREDDAIVLRNIFESLRPGGAVLIDLFGKETLAKVFQNALAETLPDGTMLVQQPRIVDGWSRIVTDWTVIRKRRARKFRFQLNLYSGYELRQAMERAGFVKVKLYGNLDGDPYDTNATRLLVVGRKE